MSERINRIMDMYQTEIPKISIKGVKNDTKKWFELLIIKEVILWYMFQDF